MADETKTPSGEEPESIYGGIQKQPELSFANAVEIAWKSIRVRLVRSLLVTSGIILALAFLTHILCSDALARNIMEKGSTSEEGRRFVEELMKKGELISLSDKDAQVQTWWLVGLALVVSFVGILNSMLLSVSERFKEIGTMKCLGALDRLIVEIFLLESTFQGFVGTLIGISIGLVLTVLEGLVKYGFGSWSYLPVAEMAKLVGICLVTGLVLTIVGALYPAWRAARMQPVDAMRSEV